MTIATRKLTLFEYLAYEDGTDIRYELIDGDLMPMAVGSGEHGAIADFLNDQFKDEIKRVGLPWTSKQMTIAIQSPRGTRWDTARIPDVVVLPTEQWVALRKREALIQLNEPAPLLVVEVVSESTRTADYRAKHSEYSVLDISEYWIVDPLLAKVTVCLLNGGRYDEAVFTGDDVIQSSTFPGLKLTVSEILNAQ